MSYSTKLSLLLLNLQKFLEKKIFFFDFYFAKGLFFLFFGFILGNLFGSLLNIFRESIIWNGSITICILIIEEIISYLIYHSDTRTKFFALNFIQFNNWIKHQVSSKNNIVINVVLKRFCYIKNLLCDNPVSYSLIRFYNFSLVNLNKNITIQLKLIPPSFVILNFIFIIKKKLNNYFCSKKEIILKNFNLFKIGILFGFFIDAFKVGS